MQHLLLVLVLFGAPIASIDRSILSAKSQHPETFARVASIVSRADKLDHHKRGPFASMGPMFRSLGPNAGPALMEPLLHPERFAMPKEERARVALRVGLIEAAGALSDPSAAPLWRSILDESNEMHEVRAAAEALGRVASDADAAHLIALATTKGPKQQAVVSGIGSCRRIDVARALGDVGSRDPVLAALAARSLARLGSSWAPDAAKLVVVRSEAARQAIRILLTTSGDARTAASDALMAIDSPDTPAAISDARAGASAEQNQALDEALARFAHNPVR
jgi:hypothetical protein